MKTFSLKLPDRLHARLASLAEKKGLTKSDLVRDALEAHCQSEEASTPGSFAELTRDAKGCCEGPPDLSYNKDHMRGFGQ